MSSGGVKITGIHRNFAEEEEEREKANQPPRKVVPIVFVPGIAGTNLKTIKGLEDLVSERTGIPRKDLPDPWRPPFLGPEIVGLANKWKNYSPMVRQGLLNIETSCVDNEGFLELGPKGLEANPFLHDGRRFRGWFSVFGMSYVPFLESLERDANAGAYLGHGARPEEWPVSSLPYHFQCLINGHWTKRFAGLQDAGDEVPRRLPSRQVRKIFKQSMPVYACGYNWLKSNKDSGQYLLEVIKKIIGLYREAQAPTGKPLYLCDKVILVTHSMGGLVAQAAVKFDTGNLILGVVHAVMPAVGTPVAYRRLVAGCEPDFKGNIPFVSIYLNGAAVLLGRTTQETTPVMANSPGCLQLLPTGGYPPGWLVAASPEGEGRSNPILKLPRKDPYSEIYAERNAWYRLVDPSIIDACKIHSKIDVEAPWKNYRAWVYQAKAFHEWINSGKDPNRLTYACYGDDSDKPTFGTVRWLLAGASSTNHVSEARISKAYHHGTSGGGALRIGVEGPPDRPTARFDFAIQDQDTSGDGTVAWQSGSAPGTNWLKGRIWPLKGIDHVGAFGDEGIRLFTLWAIIRILEKSG